MSLFKELVERIIKEESESKFNTNDIVALKMNQEQIGKIADVYGNKHGRLYYIVSYPTAIGAYVGNYKFGWIRKIIPADQLILSSEDKLLGKIEEIKNKYKCK